MDATPLLEAIEISTVLKSDGKVIVVVKVAIVMR